MSNPSARKGSKWERDGLAYLRGRGHEAERLAKTGVKDEGDLVFRVGSSPPFITEAKAERKFDFSGYVDEAEVEAKHWAEARGRVRGDVHPVAFVKRPGKSYGAGYAVMTIDNYLALLERAFG